MSVQQQQQQSTACMYPCMHRVFVSACEVVISLDLEERILVQTDRQTDRRIYVSTCIVYRSVVDIKTKDSFR